MPETCCELRQPPLSLMDFYRTPSDHAALEQWLLENCRDTDVLVMSVEQLLYGGLLASRNNRVQEKTCLERLSLLKRLKRENPSMEIYLFSIIMRATVSTLNAESQRWWELVAQYSQAAYQAQTNPCDVNIQALDQLAAQIPSDVLEKYHAVRRRNHKVNKACVGFVGQGIARRLLLLQEDCAPRSLQVLEQQSLRRMIDEMGVSDRVDLHNGTDEAANELCVRALLQDRTIPLQILWLGENRDFIARYEDRPFRENLASHFRLMNCREEAQAASILAILPPKQEQFDNCPPLYDSSNDYTEKDYEEMVFKLLETQRQGKRCYLLDLTHANGGDIPFMRFLNSRLPLTELTGYSAWNTASNALGTILAQIGSDLLRGNEPPKKFLWERLLDDLLYQSIVRQRFQQALKAAGEDIWNLSDMEKAQATLLDCFQEIRPLVDELMGSNMEFTAKLRWPRIFEIDVTTVGTATPPETQRPRSKIFEGKRAIGKDNEQGEYVSTAL